MTLPTVPGDSTLPRVACLDHDVVRYCALHSRAENPPEAARKWLRKHGHGTCRLGYAAGVVPKVIEHQPEEDQP